MSAIVESDAGTTLVLGSGMIGSAVLDALTRKGALQSQPVSISWRSGERSASLSAAVEQMTASTSRPTAVVWAAGRAGFSADTQACEQELQAFGDVLGCVEALAGRRSHAATAFHMVSSAGGLFEGLVGVTSDLEAAPRRPYGRLKAEQEKATRALAGSIAVCIYRVSSVYGCPAPQRRAGLVGVLVENGLTGRPSQIYGAMDTLRDFVWSEDVGRHIAARVGAEISGRNIEMLVSGAPTPITRVISLVERAIRHRVYVSFVDAWNSLNITFDSRAPAVGFRRESLQTGIRRVAQQYLSLI